jgi:hypothetical protein
VTAPQHRAAAKQHNPAQRTEQPPTPEAEIKPAPPMPGLAVRRKAGDSTGLPNADSIQHSFGRHDISHVQAYTGGQAQQAGAGLAAHAYAQGTDIHVGAPTPEAIGHEAAHIVQQRQGRVRPVLQQDDAAVQGHPSARGDVGL